MKGDKKIAGYVKRHFKHQDLVARYQAKLDAIAPLKRKVEAAAVDLKLKRQTLTGGELHKATTEILKRMRRPQDEVAEVMQGFDNRHED